MEIDSLLFVRDSVCVCKCAISNVLEHATNLASIIDWACKVAMVIIAIFNIIYAIKLDFFKNKKDEEKEIRNRKIGFLKSLILDHNLTHLYEFFVELKSALEKLRAPEPNKREVETNIQEAFSKLENSFIIYLEAADSKLGKTIRKQCDDYRDCLMSKIVDEGINLYVEYQYNDSIKTPFDTLRSDIIRTIFNYKGD